MLSNDQHGMRRWINHWANELGLQEYNLNHMQAVGWVPRKQSTQYVAVFTVSHIDKRLE